MAAVGDLTDEALAAIANGVTPTALSAITVLSVAASVVTYQGGVEFGAMLLVK